MQTRRETKGVVVSRALYVSIGLALLVIPITCLFTTTQTTSLAWPASTIRVHSSHGGRKTMEERHLPIKTAVENRTAAACCVGFSNFWRQTEANFTICSRPDRHPSFISKSGSAYWDFEDHVVRFSNHWTGQNGINRIVDCYWSIDMKQDEKKQFLCGKCRYADFVLRKKTTTRTNQKPYIFG